MENNMSVLSGFTVIVFLHLNIMITCLRVELLVNLPWWFNSRNWINCVLNFLWLVGLCFMLHSLKAKKNKKQKKPNSKFPRARVRKEQISVLNHLELWMTSTFPGELNTWKAIQKTADNLIISWCDKELRWSIILGLPYLSGQIFLFQKWPMRELWFAYIWQIPFIPSWQLWEQAHPVSSAMF